LPMSELPTIVPPPNLNDHKISPWIDEQIWGHRLWDGQTPWLLFLEFLTVAEACQRDGRLLDEQGQYYPLTYKPYKRMYLRNILFNNEIITQLAYQNPDSNTAWDSWLAWMADKASAVPNRDFSYLRTRFHSFREFSSIVGMLRGAAVESETNKRWTSRFVFPFGPNSIYEDLNISASGAPSREYINFGRTGELLYLMLCRSSAAGELKGLLGKMLVGDNAWDRLLGILQPNDDDLSLRGRSYLPYRAHPTFNLLGEDWLSIYKLRLPEFDALPHLVTLGALHVLIYQLALSLESLREQRKLFMVCEVVAPKKTLIRELSSENYLSNNSLPAQAVERYIDDIEGSGEWQRAVNGPGAYINCKNILQSRVFWGDDYDGATDPTSLIKELRSTALKRHRQHVANVHRAYGKGVGLVSKRGTTKLRYAPNDSLLKTLVYANVDGRMELSEFLDRLFTRYGFVFGDREAEMVIAKEDFDKKAFQANASRLEQRLGSLGMLRRLSDACAYVENPYGRRSV
jgi:hypothetical protein